jgi:DNA mismatch repair ATPase MutS
MISFLIRVNKAQLDTMRSIFERFDASRKVWSAAVSCTAFLDALLSLASVSASPAYVWPTIVARGQAGPVVHIHGGRHPMLEHAMAER